MRIGRPSRGAVIAAALAFAGFGLAMELLDQRHGEDEQALRREALETRLSLPGPETAGVLDALPAPAGLGRATCTGARTVCFSSPAPIAAATDHGASGVFARVARELGVRLEARPGEPARCHVKRRVPEPHPQESFLLCGAPGVTGADEVTLELRSVTYRPGGAKPISPLPRGTILEVTDYGSVASRRKLEAEARGLGGG